MLPVPLLLMKQSTDLMRLRSDCRKISGPGREPGPFPFCISVLTPRRLNLHKRLAAKLKGSGTGGSRNTGKTPQQRFQRGDAVIECCYFRLTERNLLSHPQKIAFAFDQGRACRDTPLR